MIAEKEILEIIDSCRASDFYKIWNIPPNKLQNAMNYPMPSGEKILALVDATIFGSAKVGMVIGLQGICWKNDRTMVSERNFLTWAELAQSKSSIIGNKSKLILAPGCVFDMTGSSMKSEQLACLLIEIIIKIPEGNFEIKTLQAPTERVPLRGVARVDIVHESSPNQHHQGETAGHAGAHVTADVEAFNQRIGRTRDHFRYNVDRFRMIFRELDHEKARPMAEFAMRYINELNGMIDRGQNLEEIVAEGETIFKLSDHFIEVSWGREELNPDLINVRQGDSQLVATLRQLLAAKLEIIQETHNGKDVDDFMKI